MRRSALLLIASALLLGACGGGEDSDSEETSREESAATSTAIAPKNDFVAEVDAVCIEEAKAVNDAFNEQPHNPVTPQDFAAFLPDRVKINQETQAKLKVIEAPPNLADSYAEFAAAYDGISVAYAHALAAASHGDSEAFGQANLEINRAQQTTTDAAAVVGLQACASHLPAEQKADLREVTEDIWTHGDPAHCTEDYTSAFVLDQGGEAQCAEDEEDPSNQADSVNVSNDIPGVSQVTATVEVSIHGGSHDGERYSQAFEYEDGRWKLDQLFPLN